ncbi:MULTISPECIES: DUF2059 domain-containing protein [Methylobacterium]|jgi:hypothetical protein|uniref:DUF2059 domain-containing protein n=1 Tax=Methylobacterium TaxID=407 RepID=UPI0008E06B80|nr:MULTISPECIES: DUF2059 domain-containing protein [Methylobacterium]MBZ6412896.1 DUF2059 domain-containing protein [Methylobacterium sp.]MBK3396532.1 DUF2059 domain-containing protein [Methylobacterium ajmalii]MBK3409181.1 DUF2059 domain-containing protein [Methylobacterium ajmalii]MBK3421325.1 DUF2059 domain-containing protein [Methylobacterium ajmalii]SFE96334.1 hypothetical protein SAMN04487844_10892 [Methylobacterium sp. yr596]
MSPRRSRILLAGLLAASLATPALAQTKPASPVAPQAGTITPSHLALAKEVMLSSGIARSFDSILPAFGEQIKQAAVTRPELSKDLGEVLEKLQPELELQKQRIIETASRIYANKLTEAELRDVATFFRSPAGKRYVETQPQVLDDMVQAMQTWTQEVSEYMMVRVRAEMGKRGHQLQ